MERPNEKQADDMAEGTVDSFDGAMDQGLIPPPDPSVRRKTFKGKGDSLNSMAERDRARLEMAKGASALRIANLRKI